MRLRKNKYIISILVVMILACTTIFTPLIGFADTETSSEEHQPDGQVVEQQANSWRYEDGMLTEDAEDTGTLKSMRGSTPAPWSKVNGKFYSSNGKVIDGAIKKGIDVSYWNYQINWAKVKASDVDFAIIRCGYGSNSTKNDDSTWARNVAECERLGIPYGVYIYSYADTVTEAESEAKHVLRLIKGHKPDYPIYYDLEDTSVALAGRTTIINMAIKFCTIMKDNGYTPGIYANLNWWNNKLNDSRLDKYEKWVAQYNSTCDYAKKYRIWQSTSSGTVPGIDTKTDLNFEFDVEPPLKPEPEPKPEPKPEDIKGWVKNSEGKYVLVRYNGNIVKSKWVTLNGKKYYANSSGMKTIGYKKIGDYYYLFNSSGVMRTGTIKYNDKKYVLGTSGKSALYSARTKEYLNYRTGPSTSYKVKGVYNKGKILYIIRAKNGWGQTRAGYWVKLTYTKKVTTYPQFVPYKVKTTEYLNYRTGPSTSYKLKGTYNKGKILTIKAVKNGWGKASTGYWILLKYTKRI